MSKVSRKSAFLWASFARIDSITHMRLAKRTERTPVVFPPMGYFFVYS